MTPIHLLINQAYLPSTEACHPSTVGFTDNDFKYLVRFYAKLVTRLERENDLPVLVEIMTYIKNSASYVRSKYKSHRTFSHIKSFNELIHRANNIAHEKGLTTHIETLRMERFKKVINKVKGQVLGQRPKHLQQKRRPLRGFYWWEKRGIKIKYKDAILIQGHIYPNVSPDLAIYFSDWSKKFENGTSLQNHLNFDSYLNVHASVLLAKQPEVVASIQAQDVHYFSEAELNTLEVGVENGQLSLKNNLFIEWMKNFLPLRETANYLTYSAYLQKLEQIPADTFQRLPKGKYIFIINSDNKIYISVKIRGEMNHSSLASGFPILAGGELEIDEKGNIQAITNWSGHYPGDGDSMAYVLNKLKEHGVNIDGIPKISLERADEYDRLPSINLVGSSMPKISVWVEARLRVTALIKLVKNLSNMKQLPRHYLLEAKNRLKKLRDIFRYDLSIVNEIDQILRKPTHSMDEYLVTAETKKDFAEIFISMECT